MKKRRMKKAFRQGDLIIISGVKLPKDTKKMRGKVVAEGELTGHKHRIVGDAAIYEHEAFDESKFLKVNATSHLVHEEHERLELEPGTYEIRQQRQYDPEETGLAGD